MAAFLVTLREGVEAAIIVAILLGYLNQLGRTAERRWVWAGTISAALVSLAVGIALWNTIGGLEGTAEEVAEGVIAFVAVGLLTWMVFWMGRQARSFHAQLSGWVDAALVAGGATALAMIAFISVLREGVETALFLISTTVGSGSSTAQLLGGLLGLMGAVLIGVLFYVGSTAIDLRGFFRVTGVLIIFFAAGLVSKGVHEFQEVGLLPTFNEHVWDLGVLDPATSTIGQFLKSLFGWTPRPSVLMILAYVAYLIPVLVAYLRMTATPPTDDRRSTQPAATASED